MPTKNKPNTKPTKHACILHPGCAATLCQQHFVYTRVEKIAFREFHQAHKKYRAYAHVVTFRPAHRFCWSHTRGAAAMPSHRARRTRDLNERPPPHIIRSIMFGAQTCLCQCARYERVCVRVCERAHEKRKTHTVQNMRKNYVMQLAQFVGAQTNTPTLHNML